MTNLTDKRISHYKILEKLGEGGMGQVYLAENTRLKRKVALKLLPVHLTVDKEATQRFEREAQAAAALNHPNIITIYEIGEFEGQIYIAMEYVEGKTLRQKISDSPRPIDEVIDIAIQICKGLSKAHHSGTVHRDIKPENILITADGRVKIADFGMAKLKGVDKLTKETSTLGTIHYMSPEQIQGEEVDHRSDIWSFGVVLYEMITSELPFKGEYVPVIIYSILNEKPESITNIHPNLPVGLEQIVNKTLEKNKNKRYEEVDDILVDLRTLSKQIERDSFQKRIAEKNWFRKRSFYFYGALALLLVLISLIGIFYFPSHDKVIDSIAVLPLENLSKDPEQEYFSDGMTDALITELGKLKALRIISRTSVMRYKRTDKLLPQIAEELNVKAIVEGSILQADNKVRINAKLFEAKSDRQLWSENYQRDLTNLLFLQSEVAQAIAREIKIAITPDEQTRLTGNAYQINPDAHEAYLKGKFFIQKWTEEDIKRGIDYLNQAIEIDPKYAPAYAGIACGYEFMIWLGWLSPIPGWEIVEKNARNALQIDQCLAEAHVMLAELKKFYDYDWDGAEWSYKRAIELNPGFAFAHQTYAWYLSIMGRHDEAIAEINLAKKFDPFSAHNYQTAGWLYYHAHRYDEMIANINEALKINPNFAAAHLILGIAYLERKMYTEALHEIKNAERLEGGNMPKSELARAYALMGQKEKAYYLLNKLIAGSKRKYIPATYIANIYVGLGEKDRAMEWLNKAYEERTHDLITINVRPCFEPLHSDLRFIALVRKIGLEK